MNTRFFIFALLLVASGCSRRPNAAAAGPVNTSSRDSDVLTAQELSDPSLNGGSLLEAVQRLRPRFLASRGRQSVMVASAGSVHVSINGGPLLSVNDLSRMRPGEVMEIRYLSATEAAQRFGTNSGSGPVLLVRSK